MTARRLAGASAFVLLLAVSVATGGAAIFGPEPVALTRGTHAPSGGAAVSGDNRTVRYVAFHSYADNLVPGDTNGTLDVFVKPRRGGSVFRASVSAGERQANGPSANPAVDGSVQDSPRCVAFQSQATNLARGDHDRHWDIYVRDLRARTTRLVSRGVRPSAVDPAISGDCRRVAFTAAGRVYVGDGLHPRRARRFARGTNPDVSLDGSAVTWERGHGVLLRRDGHTTRVARIGGNPQVSDGGSSRYWGVAFDTPAALVRGDSGAGSDVYLRTFRARGGIRSTRLISGRDGRSLGGTSHNGGITAYAPTRGIVVFTTTIGNESTLWYANLHTGNIDDLAHAQADGSSEPGIFDADSSARANYVAFSSTASFAGDSNGSTQDVFLKFLSGK